ncbi:MAG: DoxX family protein [Cyclobacteriaceae bacterium]|nr:DoxX family protein [Cyclobacteriaceae bacterium]
MRGWRIMRKVIDQVARFFVGGLFIFSGLIKLNDPVGTQIKMEEYFEVFATDFGAFFHLFIPWALEIGLIMIVLEIVLGVALLFFFRMNLTAWTLLLLLVFFTFLTGYSAITNAVTDCGCFGDAIKLTPWQSFYKDLVLMVFVLHLFWYRKKYVPVLRSREGWAVVLATALISFYAGIYAIRHLPFIDFRAYHVGANIPEQMRPPEQPLIEYTFKRGEEEVRATSFLTEPGLTYVSSRVLNEDQIKPKITDYTVTSPEGEDLTQATFVGSKLMVVMYDVAKASPDNIERVRQLTQQLEGKVDCYILTSSEAATVDAFRHEHQLAIPFYFTDATVLKTIIRSNPGLALWRDGTVLGNWHHNDTPTYEDVLELLVAP